MKGLSGAIEQRLLYLIAIKRTAVGKYGGALLSIPAWEMAAILIRHIISKMPKIKNRIDEVIIGNVLSAGVGQNPARIAAIKAGIAETVPAYTINQVCGSGLKSIILGVQSIQNRDAEIVVAGGMENMSRAPYLLDNYRFGARFGDQYIRDEMIFDGLYCSLIQSNMGITAENLAKNIKSRVKNKMNMLLKVIRKP